MQSAPATEVDNQARFWTKTSLIQISYSVWASLVMIENGFVYGFSAVTVPLLIASGSEFNLSISEQSWIASVTHLSSPIGCITSGYIMDTFGRRPAMILCEVPLSIGWICIALANETKHIIIGRIFTGIGVGMAMLPSRVFGTEISLPNIRGVIGAIPALSMSLGLTLMAGLGSVVPWQKLSCFYGVFAIFVGLTHCFIPESPYFALMKLSEETARKCLKQFRSSKHNLDKEMEELLEYKMANNIHVLSFRESLILLLSKAACRPFWIMMVYVLLSQMTGVTILFTFTVEMLDESRTTVEANTGNIILGVTRIFSGLLVSYLLYRVGKRPLSLLSGFGSGVCMSLIGIHVIYGKRKNVFPVICYVGATIFNTIGYYTLPQLMMSEIYPLQIRGLLNGISNSVAMVLIFGTIMTYKPIKIPMGFANTMIYFGVVSFITCIFLYFFLPETKGLTLQEIEEYFNERRPTLVSQKQVMSMQMSSTKDSISKTPDGKGASIDSGSRKNDTNMKIT